MISAEGSVNEQIRSEKYRQLEQAIAALEAQRAILGDAVVEAALGPMQQQLAELEHTKNKPAFVFEDERKLVTVMFADISGFTALAEQLDPEAVRELMNACFDRLVPVIEKYEGTVEKFIGDEIMAIFGAPVAHENDPERALRTALEMMDELKKFNADQNFNMGLHIGVDTGLVIAGGIGSEGQQQYGVMGDTVNLAKRLEEVAQSGCVLISHATYCHIRGVFDVMPQESIQIKGKVEPMRTYLVQRAKPRVFNMGIRGVEGIETRMVGREAELVTLQNVFRDTMEDADTRIVTVVGEAGVGKSRLLYEFDKWIKLLPEEIRFFKGWATPEMQASPYGVTRRMFAHRFKILESDNAAEVMDKFRAGMAAALDPNQADLAGHLIGFDFSTSLAVQNALESESFRKRALAGMTEYFRVVAREPTVIFLEDIHWADDSSLDLIDHLAVTLPETCLLVVCLARPALFEQRSGWGEGQEAHISLELKALSRRESRALVTEILQNVDEIPIDLRDLVVEGSEGNPFYVEELIKMLIDDGVIRCDESGWQGELERLVEVQVPPTLTGVLQARLDSLPRKERELLQRASVVGRLFWDMAVAELAAIEEDCFDKDELIPLLAAIRNRELVFRREHSTFAGTDEYTFKHALLRDVAYETVLLKLRRVYHAQVAQWLEHTAGERISEHLSLIARHYELAGETAKASAFWRRSGEELLKISAFRDAVSTFERALALLPIESCDQIQGNFSDADLAEKATLLVNLGSSYNWVGDSLAAVQHLEQGLALAHQIDDPQLEIEALNKLAQIASEQGDYDTAQRYLDEVLALAREQNDQVCVASTLAMLGTIAWRWGDIAQAEKCSHESLTIYRELGNQQKISQLLNILGILATLQKNYDQAEQCYEQSLEIAREIDARQLTASLLNNLGYLGHHCTGNLERAEQCYQESLLIARGIGHRHAVTSTLNNLGLLYILLGECQSACEYLREALIESAAIGAVPLTLETLVGVVQLQIAVEQYSSAAELLGLVLNHPALEMDVRQVAELTLDRLGELLPAEQLEAAMENGKIRELDAIIVEIEAVIAKMLNEPV